MMLFAHNGEVHKSATEASIHQSGASIKAVLVGVVVTLLFIVIVIQLSRFFSTPENQEESDES